MDTRGATLRQLSAQHKSADPVESYGVKVAVIKFEGTPSSGVEDLTVDVIKRKTVIGRQPLSADVVLHSTLVSKTHCALHVEMSGQMFVEDLDSVNGTTLHTAAGTVELMPNRMYQLLPGQRVGIGAKGQIWFVASEVKPPSMFFSDTLVEDESLLTNEEFKPSDAPQCDHRHGDAAVKPKTPARDDTSAKRLSKDIGSAESSGQKNVTDLLALMEQKGSSTPPRDSNSTVDYFQHGEESASREALAPTVLLPPEPETPTPEQQLLQQPSATGAFDATVDYFLPMTNIEPLAPTLITEEVHDEIMHADMRMEPTLLVAGPGTQDVPLRALSDSRKRKRSESPLATSGAKDSPDETAGCGDNKASNITFPTAEAAASIDGAPSPPPPPPGPPAIVAVPPAIVAVPPAIVAVPPAHTSAIQQKTPTVKWQYKSDLRMDDENNEAWANYSDADSASVEAAYVKLRALPKNRQRARVNYETVLPSGTYGINMRDFMQFRLDDKTRQRPVRRVGA